MKNIVLVAVLSLAGCYDPYAYPYDYYYQPAAYQAPVAGQGQLIAQAPPAPIVEEITPAPYDGAVWCDGYWNWTGVTYVWVGGRWLSPPYAGYYWYPGGYVRRPGGYAFVHGRWAPSGWRHHHQGGFVHPRPFTYRAPVPRGWSWGGHGYRGGHGGYRGGHGGHHGGHRR